jgi:hypothetical protein
MGMRIAAGMAFIEMGDMEGQSQHAAHGHQESGPQEEFSERRGPM